MQTNYDLSEFEELAKILNKSILKKGLEKSLTTIGQILVSSAEKRISEGGTAPDGTPWADWSPDYAKTRHSGHKKLFNTGDLAKDLSYDVQGADVIMGSTLDYARIHQLGGLTGVNHNIFIPARQYIGVSKFDEINMRETLKAFIGKDLEANLAH